MRSEGLEERLSGLRETLESRLRDQMIQNDLRMIGAQLDELIADFDHPPSFGDNLQDAQINLDNFQRFEHTIEVRRDIDIYYYACIETFPNLCVVATYLSSWRRSWANYWRKQD
jgi:hypothetical protein